MGNHTTWSVSLGSWGGIQVRLHSLFLLFAAFTLYLGWQAEQGADDEFKTAISVLGILLVSVLVHELGHYFAAVKLGGGGDEVVLGPLGGLSSMRAPPDPLSETAMHLAGPCTNLCICLITGAVVWGTGGNVLALLNPVDPREWVDAANIWLAGCNLTFWINWVLVLVNLLPAFPFDGGRALRSGIMAARPETASRQASIAVASLAKMTAFAFLVAAAILLWQGRPTATAVPIWFALLLLAIFLYFSAKQEAAKADEITEPDEPLGYDFSQGYTSLERSQQRVEERVGPVHRWLAQRKEAQLLKQREVEAEEESRVDDILGRLHANGIESLSGEDRMLLDRVSARYRRENE